MVGEGSRVKGTCWGHFHSREVLEKKDLTFLISKFTTQYDGYPTNDFLQQAEEQRTVCPPSAFFP